MNPRRPHAVRTAVVALALASAAVAQRTWIVDAARGEGYDFADLPEAVKAARSGDTIVVRRGLYAPTETDKGLRLLGQPGATIRLPTVNHSFVVKDVSPLHPFVMHGLTIDDAGGLTFLPSPLLRLAGLRGTVHLSHIQIRGKGTRFYGCSVEKCDGVTLIGCDFVPGLSVTGSHVSLTGCLVRGFDFTEGPGASGIAASASTIDLAQCSAGGANGDGHLPSHPGVRASRCTLIVRGDSQSRYTGGFYGSQFRSAGLDGATSSALVIDPNVYVADPPVRFATITRQRLPVLTASGGTLGRPLAIELRSPRDDLFVLWLSLPTRPLPFFDFGWFWLDLRTIVLVAAGRQGTSESFQASLPLPDAAGLRGLPLALQALDGTIGQLRYSNVAVPILR